MAGTVINDKFQAQFGFESPKYTVDTAGKITAETLDVKSILLNGKSFVQAAPDDQTSDDTGTTVSNSFDSLAVNGGVFKVNDSGNNTILSVKKFSIPQVRFFTRKVIFETKSKIFLAGFFRSRKLDFPTRKNRCPKYIFLCQKNNLGDRQVRLLYQKKHFRDQKDKISLPTNSFSIKKA